MLPTPANVYIAYVPADEAFLHRLRVQLSVVEQIGLLDAWHDEEVAVGVDRETAMLASLQNSEIIVLLISADFFASSFAYEQELKIALELHEAGRAKVLPVILRACAWEYTPLSKFEQILPHKEYPVNHQHWQSSDRAFDLVVDAIVQSIQKPKESGSDRARSDAGGEESRKEKLIEGQQEQEVEKKTTSTPIAPPPADTLLLNNLYWAKSNLASPVSEGTYHPGKNGAFYDYKTALASCPPGWRLPTKAEWQSLSADQIASLQLSHNGFFDPRFPMQKGIKGFYWTSERSSAGEAWCYEQKKDSEGRMERRYTHWALNCRLVKAD